MLVDLPAVVSEHPDGRRPWRRSIGLGVVVVLLVSAAVVGVLGLPLVLWAGATEPTKGTSRPFVRTGIEVVPWVAAACGLAAGTAAGWWYRTGRNVPTPPSR